MNHHVKCPPLVLLRTITALSLFVIVNVLFLEAQEDTTPPVLVGFDFSPKQVDTSSVSADITLSLHITDNLSGYTPDWSAVAVFTSPSGGQQWNAYAGNLITGTTLDGVYQATLHLPAFSESGNWSVSFVGMRDRDGNQASYY